VYAFLYLLWTRRIKILPKSFKILAERSSLAKEKILNSFKTLTSTLLEKLYHLYTKQLYNEQILCFIYKYENYENINKKKKTKNSITKLVCDEPFIDEDYFLARALNQTLF
jgi:hypothetical protein